MQIVYKADDGTEFNDEYECESYEWMLVHKESAELVKFYDKNQKELNNLLSAETYDLVWTIVVPTAEAAQCVEDIGRRCGWSAYKDISEAGIWKWNKERGVFVKS